MKKYAKKILAVFHQVISPLVFHHSKDGLYVLAAIFHAWLVHAVHSGAIHQSRVNPYVMVMGLSILSGYSLHTQDTLWTMAFVPVQLLCAMMILSNKKHIKATADADDLLQSGHAMPVCAQVYVSASHPRHSSSGSDATHTVATTGPNGGHREPNESLPAQHRHHDRYDPLCRIHRQPESSRWIQCNDNSSYAQATATALWVPVCHAKPCASGQDVGKDLIHATRVSGR